MPDLRIVEGLCDIIEHQAKLIHQLTLELENSNGISRAARQMAKEIEEEQISIMEE